MHSRQRKRQATQLAHCVLQSPVHGAAQALSAAFAADDLEAALDTAMRLRYTERIREAIEKRLPG